MIDGLSVLIIVASAWRLAYLLSKEKGPFGIMTRLRNWNSFGGLLICVYCSSVWTAALSLILWYTSLQVIVWIFGVSGLAMLAHRFTGGDLT